MSHWKSGASYCFATFALSLSAHALPIARVDVLEFLTPQTGNELRQTASADVPDGTITRDVVAQDATSRNAEARATTGITGFAGAYAQVGVPAQPGGPGEAADLHHAAATARYVMEWEVASGTLPPGTVVSDAVIDLAIDGEFTLDFRPDQQPNFAFGFWDFGDEASFEDTLTSQETLSVELSLPGGPSGPEVLASFAVGMDDSGDVVLDDGASDLGLGAAFDDALSVQRPDGTATYSQVIDTVIPVALGRDVQVGEKFEVSVSFAVLAEMVGVTAFFNGERYVATATADFLNSASYSIRSDTADVSFVPIPIPEPSTALLMGLGLIGMSRRNRAP